MVVLAHFIEQTVHLLGGLLQRIGLLIQQFVQLFHPLVLANIRPAPCAGTFMRFPMLIKFHLTLQLRIPRGLGAAVDSTVIAGK